MQRILIPTDFSKNAWNAIDYAIKLFRGTECAFYLLNTYTPVIPSGRLMAKSESDLTVQRAVGEASQNGLKRTLLRIQDMDTHDGHQFHTISSFNLLVEEVKELGVSLGIDLVVTGTKGASGKSGVFMGSNTVRMIKSARNCPILAIPHHFSFRAPRELAFATDFTRFYTESELGPLLSLAQMFRAKIHIVHVEEQPQRLSEIQEFNRRSLQKQLQGLLHEFHSVALLESVSQTLEAFSKDHDIQLLALLHYQHSYMERMTREPIIQRAAFHTQIPLLVIPELGLQGYPTSGASDHHFWETGN